MRLPTLSVLVLYAGSLLAQGPDEYWLGLEEYAVHTSGDLEGMTTYRLYLNMLNPTDYLSACSGSVENPWILESTSTPAWYNTPSVSELFADAINPAFFDAFPNLEYDSWLTIGASSAEDGMDISNVEIHSMMLLLLLKMEKTSILIHLLEIFGLPFIQALKN